MVLPGDLSEHRHRAEVVEKTVAELGRLDILVNNAAFQSPVDKVEDLTHEQFAEHWGTVHPPLARAHHPGLARYVQHVITDALTPDAPPFDGLAELGFASAADLADRLYGGDADRAAIDADVATFLDLTAGRLLTGSDLVLR